MLHGRQIKTIFARVSGGYDRANHLASLGIDFYWRWRLTRLVAKKHPQKIADFATGSGDVAFFLRKHLEKSTEIFAYDFSPEMLERARQKQKKRPVAEKIAFREADCMNLSSLPEKPFDVCTIAFGVRNFLDRKQGLSQIRQTLRPSGTLFVLEFSQPYRWLRPFYRAYLKFIMPLIVKPIAQDGMDYRYLTASINAFPTAPSFTTELLECGFTHVKTRRLTGGIVAIHEAFFE